LRIINRGGLNQFGKGCQADRTQPVVLVVDDEAPIADTTALLIRQNGMTSMVAYDAESALETARITPPDLLLTDVDLPGLSGIELAIAIKAMAPECGIFLFSANAKTSALLEFTYDAGHNFTLLQKPIQPAELLAKIRKGLQRDQ